MRRTRYVSPVRRCSLCITRETERLLTTFTTTGGLCKSLWIMTAKVDIFGRFGTCNCTGTEKESPPGQWQRFPIARNRDGRFLGLRPPLHGDPFCRALKTACRSRGRRRALLSCVLNRCGLACKRWVFCHWPITTNKGKARAGEASGALRLPPAGFASSSENA